MTQINLNKNKASSRQVKYILILSNDLLFTRGQRNAHVSIIVGKQVNNMDELTSKEASDVIRQFLYWKDNEQQRGRYKEF